MLILKREIGCCALYVPEIIYSFGPSRAFFSKEVELTDQFSSLRCSIKPLAGGAFTAGKIFVSLWASLVPETRM